MFSPRTAIAIDTLKSFSSFKYIYKQYIYKRIYICCSSAVAYRLNYTIQADLETDNKNLVNDLLRGLVATFRVWVAYENRLTAHSTARLELKGG